MKHRQKSPKRTLKAIDILIKHYSKYKSDELPTSLQDIEEEECPLCVVHSPENSGSCYDCPWLSIDSITCTSEANYRLTTTEVRLERLNRWKKIIQEGL